MIEFILWAIALVGGICFLYYSSKYVHHVKSKASQAAYVPRAKALDDLQMSMLYIDMKLYLKNDAEISILRAAVEKNPNDYKSTYRLKYLKDWNDQNIKSIVSKYTSLTR